MEITIKWNVDSKSDEEAKKKVEALLTNAHGTLLLPNLDAVSTVSYFYKLKEKIDRLKMDLQNRDDEIQGLKTRYQKLRERYAQCEMDLYNRDHEIQDLKLENDRLKQREEKMLHVIKSIACDYGECKKCLFYKAGKIPCTDAEEEHHVCVTLLKELEDL